MSGQEGDLSPKQEASLKQFKENIKDIMRDNFDDYYLLKWLRARAWDLKKSEKMLRDSLEWHERFGTATILDWTAPEVLTKYYPGGFYGVDNVGCPIWYDMLGRVDLKGMYFSAKKSDIIRYRMQCAERFRQQMVPELSKKYGKRIEQCSMIFDMEGIGRKHLWKPAVETFIEMLKILEANYPETLKICYVINAPSIFPILYNLVKPFLSEDTKKKIKILRSDWRQVLVKEIPADQLPVHWGGTAQEPDEFCSSKLCVGGTIPESYRQTKPDVDMSTFTTVTVSRGGSEQIPIDITTPGQILSWQFWTDSMDIGFGVYKRTSNERQKATEMTEVVKNERVNCHIIPEDGSLTIKELGTYVLRFDNTYSWVNAKKVSYQLDLLEPDNLEELHINASDIATSF